MKHKTVDTYEARLYIGCKEGYNGREFNIEELSSCIAEYQNSLPSDDLKAKRPAMPVRITPTAYMFRDYYERGWEVAAICYPRRPYKSYQIADFMVGMAEFLLVKLKQNRISVIDHMETVMVEADNPEDRHDAPRVPGNGPERTG